MPGVVAAAVADAAVAAVPVAVPAAAAAAPPPPPAAVAVPLPAAAGDAMKIAGGSSYAEYAIADAAVLDYAVEGVVTADS